MKRFMFLMVWTVAVLALSGCGSSSEYDDERRYHLVDQDGYGVSDVRYTCNGETVHLTDASGGFYFYNNDDCSLQLKLSRVDSQEDDLYIEKDSGKGVKNIKYECESGLFGRTDKNGHFEYDNVYGEDICTFQF